MTPKVKWHQDERVSQPDMSAMGDYTEAEIRRLGRFIAEPVLSAIPGAAINTTPNATWKVSVDGIVYEPTVDVRITVKAGTQLFLGASTTGDILDVEADVILDGYCPTSPIPAKLLMARVNSSKVDAVDDRRIFYDTPTKGEREITVPTQEKSEIEWTWVDNSVSGDVLAAMAAGYQPVALMELDYATFTTTWCYILPKTDVTAVAPGEVSIVQALTHITKQIGRILYSKDHEPSWWTKAPPIALDVLNTWKGLVDVTLTLFSTAIDTLTGNIAALSARANVIEQQKALWPRVRVRFTDAVNTDYPLANAGTGCTWEGEGISRVDIDPVTGNYKCYLLTGQSIADFKDFRCSIVFVDPDHYSTVPASGWCPLVRTGTDPTYGDYFEWFIMGYDTFWVAPARLVHYHVQIVASKYTDLVE